MYELTGKAQNLALDFKTNKAVLTLVINEKQDVAACYDALQDTEKLSIKIDKFREKRSLSANNYAWKLINEIGNRLRAGKNEIYLTMLKKYGQVCKISMYAHIPPQGFFKYYEELGESTLNGQLYKHYKVYKGSSEFDTREMSIFIDGIVSDAKELGIQTETPEQLAEMKSLWVAVTK